jgi:hypothetical protein
MKDDGYFESINIQGRWYKNDPFIMAIDASQVFFLEDIKFGPCWRVIQEFGHRHVFDVVDGVYSYGFASGQIPRRSQGTLLPSRGEPKVSNPWNNVQHKDSI